MKYILTLIILTVLPLVVFGITSNSGEYGFQFLQIPISPVSSSLAGTGIYGSGYAGAFVHNPAANLIDERFSLSIQHNLWLVDTNCTQIIYSNGTRSRHFGLAARILDYGQIDTRDDTGLIIGTYSPVDANLMVNYAMRIHPDHMIGVNAGILYEKLNTASSYGFNADMGYVFLPPVTNLTMFFSLKNLGMTSKMDKERIKLPFTYETGIGYSRPFENSELAFQIGMSKAIDADLRYSLASELTFWQMLMLRFGYKGNHDEEGLTAGFGVKFMNFDFDYGWTTFSDRLNDTHAFGVTYNF